MIRPDIADSCNASFLRRSYHTLAGQDPHRYSAPQAMAKKTQSPPKTFEDALRELEQILTDIEGGELGLEESLQKYERGNFLIQHCRGVLNTAEKQIELLSKSPDGGLASTPVFVQGGAASSVAGEAEADYAADADKDDEAAGGR